MPSPEISAHLARCHRDFLTAKTQRSRRLRPAAEALGVLPVRHQWGRDFGVRVEDGEVVSFIAAEPYQPAVETDRRVRAIVLGYARAAYPELAPLVPPRPPDAGECARCGGSGTARTAGGMEAVCPGCGGLGWSVPTLGG